MKKNISNLRNPELDEKISQELSGMTFTKNFRSHTAEEWYVFLPSYYDPETTGAVGKAIIHYDLIGNRDIFINTTIIFDDPRLFDPKVYPLVYAISDELVNRLVGYSNTLLSVHAGGNSFQAEYVH
ncbi:hypothetical protein DS745_01675 [Anaerobacillus alkaliphilus]|uniref:Uncharacterized protein n=1 Tax=Anaerobacillus alkaliphilus TaxID=1548597 RepID=A0A4Q0VXD8_9BACI|nr:hypothetical protein [Anaerobacillus alkaliphilus]RXJ04120.1 hypothetical protein DS745_01675 [Anaerobacillus alkaliphilus]